MNFLVRLLVCLLTTFVLWIGLSTLFSLCLGQEASLAQMIHWLFLEGRRSMALDARKNNIDQALVLRKAVIAELLAERMTLREAAGQFREANEIAEEGDNELVASYHSPTTEVDLCRQVLAWVRAELRQKTETPNAPLLTQLAEEFAEVSSNSESPIDLPPAPSFGDDRATEEAD